MKRFIFIAALLCLPATVDAQNYQTVPPEQPQVQQPQAPQVQQTLAPAPPASPEAEAAAAAKPAEPAKVDPCAAYMASYDIYAACQDRMIKLQRMQEARTRRTAAPPAPPPAAAPAAAPATQSSKIKYDGVIKPK